jgi:hypothetical protein
VDDRCRIYDALDDPQTKVVREAFAALALQTARLQRMVNAIENDFRIERALWVELSSAVLEADPAAVLGCIRDWCRTHLLAGPVSEWRTPLVRVVGTQQLLRNLVAQRPAGLILTDDVVTDLVSDLTDPEQWQDGRARCEILKLNVGSYVVWATFAEDAREAFPETLAASDVACDLGFDNPAARGIAVGPDVPLLELTYAPREVQCRFPTAIEAWASDPFNYYFQPAPAGMPWGVTQPWPNSRDESRGRPEVVHSPTPLAEITGPLREIY